jgi:indoleacetamide hydrolase
VNVFWSQRRSPDERRKSGANLGPLHGLPIPIKDSINTRDLRTTAGTVALREFLPKEDAPIVRALRDADALILGKTNLHELSLGWTSNNQAFGAVHNPYDQRRISGGSSGGTAAAVAGRMAPLGLAEDTEGSIRVPAALCGIVGFRPTMLRYPSAGVAPISALFDQVGPHARALGDLALFDAVVTRDFQAIRPAALKGLKLGVARILVRGSRRRSRADHRGRPAQAAGGGRGTGGSGSGRSGRSDPADDLAGSVHDVLRTLPKYLQDSGADVTFEQLVALASPDVKAFFSFVGRGGSGFVAEEVYQAARDTYRPQLRKNFREYFARTGVAAIVFPTTMVPATLIGQEQEVTIGKQKVSFGTAISRNIAPGSTAGLPGLVLPAGLTSGGLPVSLEFDGPSGTDRSLLASGLSVEGVLGLLPRPKV